MTTFFTSVASDLMDSFKADIPFIMEGIVLDTDDPNQMGRVKVWVPSVDGELYDKNSLPWCEYASPLAGYTNDFKSGRSSTTTEGQVAYGFWAIPKAGSQALVFFLNGDTNRRFFFASYYGLHANRSLPDGRNKNPDSGKTGKFSDIYENIRPEMDNLNQQFKNNLDADEAKTRGVYERQAAQDKTSKDGKEGYPPNAVDSTALDSQTYCWVTPGHHAIILQDDAENCRLRIKTCEGNQIILDDTNERIYISTARGGCWMEFDEDGHMHFFAKESISIRSGKDINMIADNNINIEAKNDINVKAVNGTLSAASKGKMSLQSTGDNLHLTACAQAHMIGKTGLFITSPQTINLTTSGSIFETSSSHDVYVSGKYALQASPVAINSTAAQGTDAECGSDPANPPIVPDHEPWSRPATTITRNKFWRK